MSHYTGIFLDKESRSRILSKFTIPNDWIPYADHLTISLGRLPDGLKQNVGMTYKLKINKIGISKTNIALGVDTDIDTKNKIPHITLAVNPTGGKPHMSNQITSWKTIKPFYVSGKLMEK